jgi:hypothetical protein
MLTVLNHSDKNEMWGAGTSALLQGDGQEPAQTLQAAVGACVVPTSHLIARPCIQIHSIHCAFVQTSQTQDRNAPCMHCYIPPNHPECTHHSTSTYFRIGDVQLRTCLFILSTGNYLLMFHASMHDQAVQSSTHPPARKLMGGSSIVPGAH